MELSALTRFLFFALCCLLLLFAFSWLQFQIPSETTFFSTRRSKENPRPLTGSSLPTQDHSSDNPHHPLDPLTIFEIHTARSILFSHPLFSSSPSSLAIHSISLDEPDKSVVLSWSESSPLPPRRASSVVRFRGESFSFSIDLSSRSLTPRPIPHSGFPAMTIEDMTASTFAPFSDPAFNASIHDRGVRTQDVACLPHLIRLVRPRNREPPPAHQGAVLLLRGHGELLHAPNRRPYRPCRYGHQAGHRNQRRRPRHPDSQVRRYGIPLRGGREKRVPEAVETDLDRAAGGTKLQCWATIGLGGPGGTSISRQTLVPA
ncbi:hypothetical protein HPP92_020932 [Vanilla planifolia]|uniref:Amine oxidase n=1 Tax=Vanilla planifolia TaxID=51239 RepID=A0A835PXW8_VANPL|nr:hypothetical protein HPP92_020932 [Vanilla planifolia]